MMEAHLEVDFASRCCRVWFHLPGTPADRIVYFDGAGQQRVDVIEPGVDARTLAPSLVLPQDAFKALVAPGADVMPPDRAQGRHLDDAVATRDRVLGLVERIIDADLAREASTGGGPMGRA